MQDQGAAVTAPAHSSTASARPLPDHDVVPAVWARFTDLDIDRGEGSWLITRGGERYLDYTLAEVSDQ